MNSLIVLPTLDGSKEAAIKRLEAWATMPERAKAAHRPMLAPRRHTTLGERTDFRKLLGMSS